MQGIRGIDSTSAFGGGGPSSLENLVKDVIAGIKKAINDVNNNPRVNLYQYLTLTLVPKALDLYQNIPSNIHFKDPWLMDNSPGIYDQLNDLSRKWNNLSDKEKLEGLNKALENYNQMAEHIKNL